MVYELISVIYTALSACFQMADKVFSAVGIALVSAICMMVLVSTVLRLFTARFVGQQINQAHDRIAAREQAALDNDMDAKYARYKTKRLENMHFKRRFRAETGNKN